MVVVNCIFRGLGTFTMNLLVTSENPNGSPNPDTTKGEVYMSCEVVNF